MPEIYDRLMINTEVYAVAERLDIPKLKDLATSKFPQSLPIKPCTSGNFFEVVGRILECTPSNDEGRQSAEFLTLASLRMCIRWSFDSFTSER